MAGLEAMISSMEKKLGMGEPNAVQSWYRSRNGADYSGNFAWCDSLITWAAVDSGNHDTVCFGTDYAYTVAHAQKFSTKGQWTAMTKGIAASGIRRGDIVFFDWEGSSSIGAIDHVGIVTSVSGGNVYTIEGNTANVCARRVRAVHDIAGFGRPAYSKSPSAPAASGVARYTTVINGLTYGYGAKGDHVTKVGKALVAKGFGKHYEDGPGPTWSDADTECYSDFQKSQGLKGTAPGQDADGVPGASTLKKLLGSLPSKPAAKPVYEPFPGAAFFHTGRTSPIITALGRRLVALGFGKHYKSGPGPSWTNSDRNNVRDFQLSRSELAGDADGIPGPLTWAALKIPKLL